MNSKKLFNFRFLKQNIKKSKSGIILSIIIVPLILSIYMVLCGLNSTSYEFVSHSQIGIYNLIFMYLIPFLYSVFLFGFVFKKPSTDFMNSMPINRRTMFVTNTVGGIILITIIQVLAAFFTFLWGALFSKIVIFPVDILETFILCWSSYVFVFTASNLAMTFSGTVQTHFVVTAIILFLVPVSLGLMDTIYSLNGADSYLFEGNDLEITDGYQVTHYDLLSTSKDYTMPFKLFMYRWSYSGVTVVKMLVLSVIYFVIGLFLYKRRKMENNEESFGSVKLHIIIKALTLIPVLLLANLSDVSDDPTALIVIVILSAVYYFVFDLIVRRKVPIKTSILSFFVTIIVIQASIMTLKSIHGDNLKELEYKDIKSVSIGENSKTSEFFYYYSSYNDTNDLLDGDYFIEDDDVLDLVLEAKAVAEKDTVDSEYPNSSLYFNIKTFSGKEYYTRIYITERYYNKIMKTLNKNENYIKHMKNILLKEDGVYKVGDDILDSKTKKIVKQEVKDNLDKINYNESYSNSNSYIEKIVYRNHKLTTYRIPMNLSDNLFKAIAEFSNKKAVQNIRGYEEGLNVTVYNKGEYVKNIYDDEDVLEFIEQNYDDEFNPNKNYYILDGNVETKNGYKTFLFYTNETTKVKSLINSSNYQNYYDYDYYDSYSY